MCKDIVKLLDPDSYFIQVDIKFAKKYGLNEAILAGKMMRLEEKLQGLVDDDGVKWVRIELESKNKNDVTWHKELPFFSPMTIRRTIASLEKEKVMLSRTWGSRSKWYRLNPLFTTRKHNTNVQNEHLQYVNCSKRTVVTVQNEQLPIIQSYNINNKGNSENLDCLPDEVRASIIERQDDDGWQYLLANFKALRMDPELTSSIENDIWLLYKSLNPPEEETVMQWIDYVCKRVANKPHTPDWSYPTAIFESIRNNGSLKNHKIEFEKRFSKNKTSAVIPKQNNGYENETNGSVFETTEADIDAKIGRIQRERNLELQSMRKND